MSDFQVAATYVGEMHPAMRHRVDGKMFIAEALATLTPAMGMRGVPKRIKNAFDAFRETMGASTAPVAKPDMGPYRNNVVPIAPKLQPTNG